MLPCLENCKTTYQNLWDATKLIKIRVVKVQINTDFKIQWARYSFTKYNKTNRVNEKKEEMNNKEEKDKFKENNED